MDGLKNLITFFFLLFNLFAYSQTTLEAPFKLKVKIKEGKNDSIKTINVKIKNLSFNTYYISNYPLNSNYIQDSICGFSLNYSINQSDPLLMPNEKVDFYVAKPFHSVSFEKEKISKQLNVVYVDFEFIAKHQLKSKNKKLIKENIKKGKLILSHYQFFNEIWYTDNASRIAEYKNNSREQLVFLLY